MLTKLEVPFLALIFLMPIIFAILGRGKEGFWLMWALATCLLAQWFAWRAHAFVIVDTRTAIALGGLVALLLFPRPNVPVRLKVFDYLIAVSYFSMLGTTIMTGAGVLAPFPPLITWIIPYLVGRRFFTSTDDIARFARIMAPIILASAAIAFAEMLSKVNIYTYSFSRVLLYAELHGEFYRMGMRRATVNVNMPIAYGLVMTLVMPWALLASRMPGGRPWYKFLPGITLCASGCSLSRGPFAACALTWGISVFFSRPKLRRLLGTIGIIGTLFVLFALDPILRWSAEFINDQASMTIVINGRVEPVNSTRQRELMREAYAPALSDAGMFGFGPIETLKLPGRYRIDPALASVESHFVMHQLNYGLVGMWLFNLFAATTIYALCRLAWRPRGAIEDLAGNLAGCQVAVLMGVLSVFFSEEFLALWLFNAGLAGNLLDIKRRETAMARAYPPTPPVAPARPS